MSNIYNEASREEVVTIMKELRFTGMLESYDEVIDDMIRRKASLSYGLHKLLTLRKDIIFTQIYQFIHRGYISSN
jgi:hypothetical protein